MLFCKKEADMALADLTVTAARQIAVDFSVPFMHTSLGILYKVIRFIIDLKLQLHSR